MSTSTRLTSWAATPEQILLEAAERLIEETVDPIVIDVLTAALREREECYDAMAESLDWQALPY